MKDLLSPRFKVIATWPDTKHKVGDVIQAGEVETVRRYTEWLKSYPHLFRKMEWWESRELEDMPKYIKNNDGVFKAEEWDVFATVINESPSMGVRVRIFSDQPPVDVSGYFPATEQEFNDRLSRIPIW